MTASVVAGNKQRCFSIRNFLYTLAAYPFFCSTVANDAEAIKKLNAMDPSAGEYMRPALEKMVQFLNDGCVCSG